MDATTKTFYDDLADSYHLIFEDWNKSVARQACILGPMLELYTGKSSPYVLDCACGIGTQTLGLAQRGHIVVASDCSEKAVHRAQEESRRRNLSITFHVADMRELQNYPESGFDAVLVADNALPHLLSEQDLDQALSQIHSKLKDSGSLVATIRNYDALIKTRPVVQSPIFYKHEGQQRIVHQVWDWAGDEYTVHLYITIQTHEGWAVRHFSSRYRALLRTDLNLALKMAGFKDLAWLDPDRSTFYQPIIVARKG